MRKILQQTSWLFFAQVLTRIIGLFYTIFLAKNLGVENFGLLTVALSYFSIISSVAEFGFNRFLTREIARDKTKIKELLFNVAILRVVLTSVLFAIFSVALYSLDPDRMRVSLILLAVLAILPQSAALTFDAVFVGLRRLQVSAMLLIISSLATFILGTFLVIKSFGSFGAVSALLFGQLVYAFASAVIFFKQEGMIMSFRISLFKRAIIGSLPYGLLGILGLLYFRVDTVILAYFRGSFETGIYGVAFRFLEAVTFIPYAFFSALFPVLAKAHDSSSSQVKQLYFKSLKLMLLVGVVVGVAFFLLLPIVISTFLPSYSHSINAIKILALAIPFMFIHTPAVSVLFSSDRYLKEVLLLSILILALNVMGNFIFIPSFGFIAASWITVISEVLSFIIFFLFTKFRFLDKI